MQSRFSIVLMSMAGAALLFGLGFALGLGVLDSPPAEQHKQIAVTQQPTRIAPPTTTGSAAHDDNRALTPVYPATPADPGQAQAESRAPDQPAPRTTAESDAKSPRASTATATSAKAAEDAATKTATPVSVHNACDVAACERAYQSFRASDCTYQPYSGPRQVCAKAPGAKEADRSPRYTPVRVHRSGKSVDVQNVAHEPERAIDGRGRQSDGAAEPVARGYHRDVTADGEDDRVVVVPADADRGGWADDDGGNDDDQ